MLSPIMRCSKYENKISLVIDRDIKELKEFN